MQLLNTSDIYHLQIATKELVAATTPSHHHVRDLEDEDDDNHLPNGDTSKDLRMDSEDIIGMYTWVILSDLRVRCVGQDFYCTIYTMLP